MKNEKLLKKLIEIQSQCAEAPILATTNVENLIKEIRNEIRLENKVVTKDVLKIEKLIQKELKKIALKHPGLNGCKTINNVQYISDSYFGIALKTFRLENINELDDTYKYPNMERIFPKGKYQKISQDQINEIKMKIKTKEFDEVSENNSHKNHGLIKFNGSYYDSFYLELAFNLIKPTKFVQLDEMKPLSFENDGGDRVVILPIRIYA